MDPNPKVELVNDVSGIVEGSDEHLEYDLFDDYEPTTSQESAEKSEPATEPDTTPAQSNTAQQGTAQKPATTGTSHIENLKERQLATTVVPALQNENKQLRAQLEQVQQSTNAYKELQTNLQNFGLAPQEAQIGFQLAASWKSDPAGTINRLLTYAASKGIKVEGAPTPQVTREMLSGLIEEKLAPVLRQHQQQEQQQQVQQEALNQQTAFFAEYPDAVQHEQAIATIMRNYGFTPQRAYVELYKYATSQGLDWNQPLQPQLQSRNNANSNPPAPPVNGYSPGVRQADNLPTYEVDLPGDDASYRSIVNSVLAQHGVSR